MKRHIMSSLLLEPTEPTMAIVGLAVQHYELVYSIQVGSSKGGPVSVFQIHCGSKTQHNAVFLEQVLRVQVYFAVA